MLPVLALTALVVLTLALARLAWTMRRVQVRADAYPRRYAAETTLATASAEYATAAAKLATALAAHRGATGLGHGFGDAHVRRARLRAALATQPDGEL